MSNLSRSVSSAGEKHSNEYSSPSLPRRAETFSGFDSGAGGKPKIKEIDIGDGAERELVSQAVPATPEVAAKKDHNLPGPQPLLMSLEPEQQQAAVQMTHYMNNLMCMVAEHFTSLETIKAELKNERDKANYSVGRYKENQRFEEMRHLQETLAQEKNEWVSQKKGLEAECEAKKAEMAKYQAEIDRGLKDVKEQREQLYRKLEVLRAQGIELGPNLSVLKTDPSPQSQKGGDLLIYSEVNTTPNSSNQSSHSPSSGGHLGGHHSGASIRKSSSLTSSSSAILTPANSVLTGGSLKKESFGNLHLMSATNETKTLDKQEIKQQIPVKLSSLSKESVKTKKSTAALIPNPTSTTAPSAKGISNLAKPEAVQQLLPFKLSEEGKSSGSPQSNTTNRGNQRYHQQQQQQYYQQHVHHPHSKHHLSGLPGGSLRYSSSSTLPKSGSVQKVTNYGTGSNAGRSGNSSGANSDDENKVIYF